MKKLLIVFGSLFVLIVLISLAVALLWDSGGMSFGQKVAIVNIEGPIIYSDDIIEELKSCEDDDSIKAVVLRINSPGGGVAPFPRQHRGSAGRGQSRPDASAPRGATG